MRISEACFALIKLAILNGCVIVTVISKFLAKSDLRVDFDVSYRMNTRVILQKTLIAIYDDPYSFRKW